MQPKSIVNRRLLHLCAGYILSITLTRQIVDPQFLSHLTQTSRPSRRILRRQINLDKTDYPYNLIDYTPKTLVESDKKRVL
jgi:hypothetical protein